MLELHGQYDAVEDGIWCYSNGAIFRTCSHETGFGTGSNPYNFGFRIKSETSSYPEDIKIS